MGEILVLGYGNTLRRDDGVGPLVAEAVSRWGRAGLYALALPQLLPELAHRLSCVDLAIFVDAAAGSPEVHLQPLAPIPCKPSLDHCSEPRWLLSLTQEVYGRCPPAWLITVPAADLSFGEGLSPQARKGMEAALQQLEQLLSSESASET